MTGGTDPGPSPVQRARRALAELATAEENGIPREGNGSYPYWVARLSGYVVTSSTTSRR